MATPEQTQAELDEFIRTVVGVALDPDGMYGLQCKDLPDYYCMVIFGVPLFTALAAGNAETAIAGANTDYFDVIRFTGSNRPARGDIVVWDGTEANEYGHIAIVTAATSGTVSVVEQDGYLQVPTKTGTYGYHLPGTGRCLGWLRPKPERVLYTGADSRGYGPRVVTTLSTTGAGRRMDGIDVSAYQADINLTRVRAGFVIVKATEGVGWVSPVLDQQVSAALAAGRRVGVYHFATALNDSDAEAAYFLSRARTWIDRGAVPFLDWEPAGLTGYTDWALDWVRYVERATGRTVPIYMNHSVSGLPNWPAEAKARPLWLAHYGDDRPYTGYATSFHPPPTPGWRLGLWQYTQRGRLPGYSGDLDLNIHFDHVWTDEDTSTLEGILADDKAMDRLITKLMDYPVASRGTYAKNKSVTLRTVLAHQNSDVNEIRGLIKGVVPSFLAHRFTPRGPFAKNKTTTPRDVLEHQNSDINELRAQFGQLAHDISTLTRLLTEAGVISATPKEK